MEQQQEWAVLEPATLTERVYGILRTRIAAGDWGAGHFLREKEISGKLGVSRTPVREALGRLAADGFLERIPHRGFKVPEKSVSDLFDLYPVLAALEVLAAKEGFKQIDEADIEALRSINDSYRAAYARHDTKKGVEENNKFHNFLTKNCNNKKLSKMIQDLQGEVFNLECWAISNIHCWDVSIREHEQLVDAISLKEWDVALALLEQNRSMSTQDFSEFVGTR